MASSEDTQYQPPYSSQPSPRNTPHNELGRCAAVHDDAASPIEAAAEEEDDDTTREEDLRDSESFKLLSLPGILLLADALWEKIES